ncbi:MAG: LLM class flavin-dependent oxidoreductase, partial [Solirubrobacteraceae bacterium]
MDVGITFTFQNWDRDLTDFDIYRYECALAVRAETLGFDSVWATEHHFTGYQMTPSPMQFLAYVAGATKRVKLGTMVTVVPWHDPYRIAVEASMLDNMSGGRFVLGLGRGLGRQEFERFRVPMEESRQRFDEHTTAILESLESGVFELDGSFVKQVSSPLRPRPVASFRGRTYVAGESPQTMPLAVRHGAGLMLLPTSSWNAMADKVRRYEELWDAEMPGVARPRPAMVGYIFVDRDSERAKEMALKHISDYFRATFQHYEFTADKLSKVSGYDHYKTMNDRVMNDPETYIQEFASQMFWGTPDEVLEQIDDVR